MSKFVAKGLMWQMRLCTHTKQQTKITLLHILSFIFLDSKQDDKGF
jgi:hypothetical protein